MDMEQFASEIKRRTDNARDTLSFEKDFKFVMGNDQFHIWLPENVLVQKKLLDAMARIDDNEEAEERFIEMILKTTHKNNQPITALSLSLPEINVVRDLYQYILLLPLSTWSQAVENREMSQILGLSKESKD
jgi:hypothetical protein